MHAALADALAREGLEEIETDGRVRPARPRGAARAAVEGVEAGGSSRCVQKGYRLGDRVLRPARVIVARVSRGAQSLRGARRPEERVRTTRSRRRTASSRASTTRHEPGRRGGRGAVQGGPGRLRHRSPTREAQAVRHLRLGRVGAAPAAGPGRVAYELRPRRPGDLGDMFGGIFGGGGRRGGAAAAAGARRTTSRSRVRLSFEDALAGAEVEGAGRARRRLPHVPRLRRRARARRPYVCPQCNGRGVVVRSRASSRSRSRARAAAATAPSSRSRARPAAAPAASADEALHGQDPGGREGRHAIRLKGKGEAGLRRRPGGRPLRRHARRAVDALRAARRRPRPRGAVSFPRPRSARRSRSRRPRARVIAQGPAGTERREAPAGQGPRRAAS